MKLTDIPLDADGDAIRRVLSHGADSSRPMKIDFHVAAPSESAGKKILAAAIAKRYEASLSRDEGTGAWTCSCSRIMLLDYESLMRSQKELDQLSAPHGGYSDGWGTFGNEPNG
jgi:regulator of RNase E activity RraB